MMADGLTIFWNKKSGMCFCLEGGSIRGTSRLGQPSDHLSWNYGDIKLQALVSLLLASDSHVLVGVNASTNIPSSKKKHSKRPQEILPQRKLIVSSFG